MLRLLNLLQTHRFWPGPELAGRLAVSQRTLRRDIDRLRELGYPVNATRGTAGGYQLQAGAALPPLLLDDDEAVAVAVGLRGAAGGGAPGVEDASVRALSKIVQVMPARLRRRVAAVQEYAELSPWAGPQVDAEAISVIASACRDGERLGFDYTTREREQARRTVDPHRMVNLGRRWYLVAWDLDRGDWRTFRVDRLVQPRTTGVRFRPRDIPGGDATSFVRASIRTMPQRYAVELEVSAPLDEVQRVVRHWGEAAPAGDGRCRLTMQVDRLEWPVMVLGMLGAEFRVLSPPELREHVADLGRLFGAASG